MFRSSNIFTYSLLYFLLLVNTHVLAQNGSIEGTATDERNEPVIGAVIEIYSAGLKKGHTQTDIDGNYLFKPLSAGVYELIANYSSYKKVRITGILISHDGTARINVTFNPNALGDITSQYKKPLISNSGKVNATFDAKDIKNAPTRDLTKLLATSSPWNNRPIQSYSPRVMIGPEPYDYAETQSLRIGSICGTAQDRDKKPLVDAKVELFHNSNIVATTKTDIDGQYHFSLLGKGMYTIRVSSEQFKNMTVDEITIGNDETATINLYFKKGVDEKTMKYKKPRNKKHKRHEQ